MKQVKLCVECNNIGKQNTTLNLILCNNCKNLHKYTLISKTNSKKLYYLKDADINNLKSFTKNTSYGIGTFYIESDIINAFCNKYNTDIHNYQKVIDNIINEKKIKMEKKLQNSINKKNERKQILINKLKSRGLSFRKDSVLCEKFINGDKSLNINDVVNRMCQMKYLFEYCHMNNCKDEVYKEQQEEFEAGYFPDCSVFDQAEYIALSKYSNNEYPDKFPWE
jgi:hypothetical protein